MSVINFCFRSTIQFPIIKKIASHSTITKNSTRSYKVPTKPPLKVAICGAGGEVGQPLSLMLKQSPIIDKISLYDTNSINGFGTELNHVDTKCQVCTYCGLKNIREALDGAKVVVVVAAAPKTAALPNSAMFEANAGIICEIAEKVSNFCPQALIAIATNPVNSLVPLASEILKGRGTYNRNTVFGVTALNIVRANTFVAEVQGLEPESVVVPVIGGNFDKTIVPVLSQSKPCNDFTTEELETLTHSIQNGHQEVIKAKNKQSPTLSAAFAIARFTLSLVKAIQGQRNIVECAYVRSAVHHNVKYLATPLLIGEKGIVTNLGIPELSQYESCQLEHAIGLIMKDVKKAEEYVGIVDTCDPCDPDAFAKPCPPNWCEQENACR